MDTSARPLVLAAGVVFAAAAQAESPDLLMAIEQAAHSGQAGEALAYGQPALVVPVLNRPCMTVGVVYQEGKHQRGGPRIDNYQVCQGGEPERINHGPDTHPKARLRAMGVGYKETSDGPILLDKIGIPAIRAA